MLQHDCATSMVYTQKFALPNDAKNEANLLVRAVGSGVHIDSALIKGGETEIRATFNCRAYRAAGGNCLLHALDEANISVPRTMRSICHPQPELA